MERCLLVLAVAACVTPAMRNKVAPLDATRTKPFGVCALDGIGTVSSPMSITSCAVRGSPGMLDDDGTTPFLLSKFQSETFGLSNPGSWQLAVRKDGREVLKIVLPERVPDVGICTSTGCFKDGLSLIRLPEAWTPGTYAFSYVCTFDTALVANMSITLQ
jgi:hypothetical protein